VYKRVDVQICAEEARGTNFREREQRRVYLASVCDSKVSRERDEVIEMSARVRMKAEVCRCQEERVAPNPGPFPMRLCRCYRLTIPRMLRFKPFFSFANANALAED